MSKDWKPSAVGPGETGLLIALSIAAHLLLALGVARARTAEPPPIRQTVHIELVPPPPPETPPVVPPQAQRAERPRLPVAARRPLRPSALPPPAETPAPSEAAPEEPLPEGDEGPPAPSAPAPAPAAVVSAPPPVQVAHEGANYLKNPRPPYPALAMRRGWQGEVLVRVRVSPEGRAAAVSIARTSGRDLLDEAALEAVRGWMFVPARQGSTAVAGWVTVPIVFRLQ